MATARDDGMSMFGGILGGDDPPVATDFKQLAGGVPGLFGGMAGGASPWRPGLPVGRIRAIVREYKVELYDLSSDERRNAYARDMKRLFGLINESRCVICKNELQVLQSGASQGWWRYLEWFEYDIVDASATDAPDKGMDADGEGDGEQQIDGNTGD